MHGDAEAMADNVHGKKIVAALSTVAVDLLPNSGQANRHASDARGIRIILWDECETPRRPSVGLALDAETVVVDPATK